MKDKTEKKMIKVNCKVLFTDFDIASTVIFTGIGELDD